MVCCPQGPRAPPPDTRKLIFACVSENFPSYGAYRLHRLRLGCRGCRARADYTICSKAWRCVSTAAVGILTSPSWIDLLSPTARSDSWIMLYDAPVSMMKYLLLPMYWTLLVVVSGKCLLLYWEYLSSDWSELSYRLLSSIFGFFNMPPLSV